MKMYCCWTERGVSERSRDRFRRVKPYFGLYHFRSLPPHLRHEPKNVNLSLPGHHVQHGVEADEGPSPTHSGASCTRNIDTIAPSPCTAASREERANIPAVDHDRPVSGRAAVLDLAEELEHSRGTFRHPEIGPASEVVLNKIAAHSQSPFVADLNEPEATSSSASSMTRARSLPVES